MSSVAEAGLIVLATFVLMFLGVSKGRGGPPIRNEDEETWWYARQA